MPTNPSEPWTKIFVAAMGVFALALIVAIFSGKEYIGVCIGLGVTIFFVFLLWKWDEFKVVVQSTFSDENPGE